jgi:hypothetical protein
MNLPGLYLHQLSGKGIKFWPVRVSGNWRITFRFNGVHAEVVAFVFVFAIVLPLLIIAVLGLEAAPVAT